LETLPEIDLPTLDDLDGALDASAAPHLDNTAGGLHADWPSWRAYLTEACLLLFHLHGWQLYRRVNSHYIVEPTGAIRTIIGSDRAKAAFIQLSGAAQQAVDLALDAVRAGFTIEPPALDLPPLDSLDTFRDLPALYVAAPAAPDGLVRAAELPAAGARPKRGRPKQPRKQAAYSEAPSDNISVNTPERELTLVRAFAPIGLDPCGNPTSTVAARSEFWGPKPSCGTCGAPATHGILSSLRAERCAAHTIRERDAGELITLDRIPDATVADPRYGMDGLILGWHTRLVEDEIVFLQPPYGRHIVPWIGKTNREADAGAEIIGLLPGRFDTKWFNAMKPALICWYRRRIPYVDHSKPEQRDSAKFPSVFVYWGPRVDRFRALFAPHGKVTEWQ